MSTALVQQEPAPLAQSGSFFSPAQESMILKTFLGGASRDEAAVLLEIVKRRKLDPFARQVYFVKRWDSQKREEVWAIQTSIDGLRSIADRAGLYEGQTKPEWCGPDGVWRDVWLDKEPPAAARVGVYKTKFREPVYGVARLAAYIQTKKDGTPTQFWARMADVMLAKCAEALALRKAFPEDTGGLYISEEMGEEKEHQAAEAVALPPAPPPEPQKPVTPAVNPEHALRAKAIWERAKGQGFNAQNFSSFVAGALGIAKPSKEWTETDMDALEKDLTDNEDVKP